MLVAEHIAKIFEQPPLTVLKDVMVTFEKGKSYAIKGASGTGKSTLLHILAGLDCPTKGIIWYNKKAITDFNDQEKRDYLSKEIGLVFQFPYLIQELTVLENVILKGLIKNDSLPELKKKGLELLEAVGIPEKTYDIPAKLSGGQQQRVALARALFNKPAFLLGDEITGNLDPQTGNKIITLIDQAKKNWGMGIVLTTHDNFVAERMDYVYELVDGVLLKIK